MFLFIILHERSFSNDESSVTRWSKSWKKSKGLEWKPDTWKDFEASQQPIWPNNDSLQKVLDELSALPPLVFAGEARNLTQQLAAVSQGKAFLLQASIPKRSKALPQ